MKKNGRPPFAPTEKIREMVRNYVIIGASQSEIAQAVGITEKTLRLHFREELTNGKKNANNQVVGALFKNIMKGNIAAQIFWLKTQLCWRETERHEHVGLNGGAIQIVTGEPVNEKEWLEKYGTNGHSLATSSRSTNGSG